MKTTKGKSADLPENVKGGKSVLESPCPAPPTTVVLDTPAKPVSRKKKTKTKEDKQRRNEGRKSTDGDSESSEVLVTKDTRRGSANPENIAGRNFVDAQDQSRTSLTNAAALERMLKECYSSLENLTNVLAVIHETWQKQHSNTTTTIEKFMSHIAKG